MGCIVVKFCCMAVAMILGCMLQGCGDESKEALPLPIQPTPPPTTFLSPTPEAPNATTIPTYPYLSRLGAVDFTGWLGINQTGKLMYEIAGGNLTLIEAALTWIRTNFDDNRGMTTTTTTTTTTTDVAGARGNGTDVGVPSQTPTPPSPAPTDNRTNTTTSAPTKPPTPAPTPLLTPEASNADCQDAGMPDTWTCFGGRCTCQLVSDRGVCSAFFSNCRRSCGLCGEDAPNAPPSSPSPSPSPPSPKPASSDSNARVSEGEWEHFKLLNELRSQGFTCPQGATFAKNDIPLEFDCRLWRAAQLHSQDMADQSYFDHYSKDGRSPWDRAEEQGISANGENIAAGKALAADVLEQWKNSDGHCKNMGNPGFKLFAVGYGFNAQSPYRHYWTQMFKRAKVELDTSCYPEEGNSTIMMARMSVEENTTAGDAVGEPWTTIDIKPLHDRP